MLGWWFWFDIPSAAEALVAEEDNGMMASRLSLTPPATDPKPAARFETRRSGSPNSHGFEKRQPRTKVDTAASEARPHPAHADADADA